jgi:hypothetical protein
MDITVAASDLAGGDMVDENQLGTFSSTVYKQMGLQDDLRYIQSDILLKSCIITNYPFE